MTKEEAQLFILYLERNFSGSGIKLFFEDEEDFEIEYKLNSKTMELHSRFAHGMIRLLDILYYPESFSWEENHDGFVLKMSSEIDEMILKTWKFRWRKLFSQNYSSNFLELKYN